MIHTSIQQFASTFATLFKANGGPVSSVGFQPSRQLRVGSSAAGPPPTLLRYVTCATCRRTSEQPSQNPASTVKFFASCIASLCASTSGRAGRQAARSACSAVTPLYACAMHMHFGAECGHWHACRQQNNRMYMLLQTCHVTAKISGLIQACSRCLRGHLRHAGGPHLEGSHGPGRPQLPRAAVDQQAPGRVPDQGGLRSRGSGRRAAACDSSASGASSVAGALGGGRLERS